MKTTAKTLKSAINQVSKVSLIRTTQRIANNLERYGYVKDAADAMRKLLVLCEHSGESTLHVREIAKALNDESTRDRIASALVAQMKKVRS